MSQQTTGGSSQVNRAKLYQLALFPMNNGATNVYYVLILTYIATFGNTVLGSPPYLPPSWSPECVSSTPLRIPLSAL